jgi:hypothetical protein
MTKDRDFDRIAAAWLDLMPDRAPDRVVAEILEDVALTPQVRRPLVRLPWVSPRTDRLMLIAATVLLGAALLGGALLVGAGRPTTPLPTPAAPLPATPSPSASGPVASTAPSTSAAAALAQTWLADVPSDVFFTGEDGLHRWTLPFAADGGSLDVRASAIRRLRSTVDASTVGELVLATTDAGGDMMRGSDPVAGCAVGDIGRYGWSISPDGLQLTLTGREDACAARSLALARTWKRSLVADSTGGRGIVDAFDPEFTVTVPHGTYSASRSPDAVEVWAADESIGFLAWKDPQGFNDPCDISAGRYPIERGATAFVDYFRRNRGFEVLSAKPLEVGGFPAIKLVIKARTTLKCPTGWLVQWQPKAETSQYHWHADPGVTDSLYLVDLPGSTVMFEVLEAHPGTEADVIGSIEFPGAAPPP